MDADDYNLKWNNFETGITRNSYGILCPLLQEIKFYFFCICIFKAKKNICIQISPHTSKCYLNKISFFL